MGGGALPALAGDGSAAARDTCIENSQLRPLRAKVRPLDALQQRPLRRVPPRRRSPSSGSSTREGSRARSSSSPRATASTSTAPGTPRRTRRSRSAQSAGACSASASSSSAARSTTGSAARLPAPSAPAHRKALLLVSVVYYLGVLSLFKYYDFAVDSSLTVLGDGRHPPRPSTHLHLVLPFGISFFTFETMSYTIDVYRRELEPARRYLDYLLFVASSRTWSQAPSSARGRCSPSSRRRRSRTPTCRHAASGSSPRGSRRRSRLATRSRSTSSAARSATPSASRPSSSWSPSTRTPSRSTATSPATPTSPSAARSSSATGSPRTSTPRTSRRTCRTSGTAGTSR